MSGMICSGGIDERTSIVIGLTGIIVASRYSFGLGNLVQSVVAHVANNTHNFKGIAVRLDSAVRRRQRDCDPASTG